MTIQSISPRTSVNSPSQLQQLMPARAAAPAPALGSDRFTAAALPIGAAGLQVTAPQELQVGQQLPAGLQVMRSENNVDAVKHDGRYYMAFRTAPTHFASTKTLMHVLSSDDGQNWKLEQTVSMGSDLREPRFLSFNGKLFLYFFQGGTNPLGFQPNHMYVSERTATGWSKPEPFFEPGFVPWRAKVHDGKAYMSVYFGQGLYGKQDKNLIYLLESSDGKTWKPIADHPQLSVSGAEEPEFEFDKDGNIWGTIRLENFGSMIFHAPKDHLDQWQTVASKDKYDSALVFRHGDRFFLIARRNMDGVMDHAPKFLPEKARALYNMGRYWFTKKRTAVYELDTQKQEIKPLFDLPSHGDTAYPGLAPINDRQYLLLNYSSKLEPGHDYFWLRGQLNTTRLYSSVITFDQPATP